MKHAIRPSVVLFLSIILFTSIPLARASAISAVQLMEIPQAGPDTEPWAEATQIAVDASLADLAISPGGNACVLFYRGGALWSDCREGGNWSGAQQVFDPGSGAPSNAHVAMDSTGSAYAIWSDDGGLSDPSACRVRVAQRSPLGSWSTPERVDDPVVGLACKAETALTVTAAGAVHVLWTAYEYPTFTNIFYRQRPTGQAWGVVERVNDGERQVEPFIAADTSGNVYAAFKSYWQARPLWVDRRPAGGSWGQDQPLVGTDDDASQLEGLSVDALGRLHVAFSKASIEMLTVYADGTMDAPVLLAAYGGMELGDHGTALATPRGDVYAIWGSPDPVPTQVVFQFRSGADQQPVETVWSPTDWSVSLSAALGLDAAGNAYAAWSVQDGPTERMELYFSERPTPVVFPTSPPFARNDSYAVVEDSPLRVAAPGLFANDMDPDQGDTLSLVQYDQTSARGCSVTVKADGSFTYLQGGQFRALNVGQSAEDTFSYTITDNHGNTAVATVHITVIGRADVAGSAWEAATMVAGQDSVVGLSGMHVDAAGTACVQYAEAGTVQQRCRGADGVWGPAQAMPADTPAPGANIVRDSQGNAYALWSDGSGAEAGTCKLIFAYKAAGGTWGNAVRVDDPGLGGAWCGGNIAVGSPGVAHFTWNEAADGNWPPGLAYYRSCAADGACGPIEQVGDVAGRAADSLVVDGAGNAYASLFTSDLGHLRWFYYRSVTEGTWGLEANIKQCLPGKPGPVLDEAGRLYLVYQDGCSLPTSLKLVVRDPNGTWSAPETFAALTNWSGMISSSVALSPDGDLYITWAPDRWEGEIGTHVYYRDRLAGGDWLPSETIWTPDVMSFDPTPLIRVDAAGNAYTAWFVRDGYDITRVYFSHRPKPIVVPLPNAVADTYQADEDAPLEIAAPGVLANDTSSSQGALSVVGYNGTTARGGSVTVNADGSFIYNQQGVFHRLRGGETAIDSFVYAISDSDGSLVTGTATIAITGINDGEWAPLKIVAGFDAGATLSALSVTPAGTACVQYAQDGGLQQRCRGADGVWGPAEAMPADTPASGANIVRDSQGNAYALWSDGSGAETGTCKLFFAYQPASGTWGSAVRVDDPGLGGAWCGGNIAVGAPGVAHFTWNEAANADWPPAGLAYYRSCTAGGACGPIAQVGDAPGRMANGLVVDGAGNVYATLFSIDPSDTRWFDYRSAATGVWGTDAQVTIGTCGLGPDPLLDGAGRLYLVYPDGCADGPASLKLIVRDPSGAWSAPESFATAPATWGGSNNVSAAVSPEGDLYVAWGFYRDGPSVAFRYRPAGGLWQPVETIHSVVFYPSVASPEIAIDGRGNVFVAWMEDVPWPESRVLQFAARTSPAGVTANQAPRPAADAYQSAQGVALHVPAPGVLTNDTDPDGDTLGVSAYDPTSTAGALVTMNPDGSFTYDQNGKFVALGPGQSATDTFSYTVSDGKGGSATATVTVTVFYDNDRDGIGDAIEDGASNNGDGNSDGISDATQSNVTSLPNSADHTYITLVAPMGTTLTEVVTTGNPAVGSVPPGATFPVGFLDFRVEGIPTGGSAAVTLILAQPKIFDGYYKYGLTPDNPTPHWYLFDYNGIVGAQVIDGSHLVLHFLDGGRGDSDLAANGVVVDPGAPAQVPQAPPVVSVVAPQAFAIFPVGQQVAFRGAFTPTSSDAHMALWTLYPGTVSAPIRLEGRVSGSDGQVSLDYAFTTPGVYHILLAVTDGIRWGSAPLMSTSGEATIVVYDPGAGFVTGGGWIESPVGACQFKACSAGTTGKASFGFVSKYQKGAKVPSGSTEFLFKAGNLNFQSNAYEWLVIAGHKAQYKGTGTINGAGRYSFMISAIDGDLAPTRGPDRFRIRIWDRDAGDGIVYDNQMSAPDDADPTTILGGGSIVIHK